MHERPGDIAQHSADEAVGETTARGAALDGVEHVAGQELCDECEGGGGGAWGGDEGDVVQGEDARVGERGEVGDLAGDGGGDARAGDELDGNGRGGDGRGGGRRVRRRGEDGPARARGKAAGESETCNVHVRWGGLSGGRKCGVGRMEID